MTELPPIRRQVAVPATAEVAFKIFTAEIGAWWPVGDGHSVYGADTVVDFRDGRVVERGPDGDEAVWGTVLDWEPPYRLRMTWHPGSDPEVPSEVEVRFSELSDEQTLVTLEHRGWEAFDEPAKSRDNYNTGWPHVLGRYLDRTGASASIDEASPGEASIGAASGGGEKGSGDTWLALMHTAGPTAPADGVFGHPDFAEHVAFLGRLRERGVLVAAGPLDGSGDGMTVVRVPGTEVAEYLRLAQDDDLSVARGLLMVRARPWRVVLTG